MTRSIEHWGEVDLKILVISLERSVDRRARLEARMREYGMSFEYVNAIDGNEDRSLQGLYRCDSDREELIYSHRVNPISSGEIACTLSHMSAVCQAHRSGSEHTLVCEDDVDFLGVTPEEMQRILEHLPNDAAYLQLCVTPEESIERLADFAAETGELYARKSVGSPIFMEDPFFDGYPVHCATAYVVTAKGAANLSRNYFSDQTALFPCDPATMETNSGLVADRLIYQACCDQNTRGYVYCRPTATYEALDSLLHPGHLPWHQAAKDAAMKVRSAHGC